MGENPETGANKSAAAILAAVGIASWTYAGLRMMSGKEGSAPLIIGGIVTLTMAITLFRRK